MCASHTHKSLKILFIHLEMHIWTHQKSHQNVLFRDPFHFAIFSRKYNFEHTQNHTIMRYFEIQQILLKDLSRDSSQNTPKFSQNKSG